MLCVRIVDIKVYKNKTEHDFVDWLCTTRYVAPPTTACVIHRRDRMKLPRVRDNNKNHWITQITQRSIIA